MVFFEIKSSNGPTEPVSMSAGFMRVKSRFEMKCSFTISSSNVVVGFGLNDVGFGLGKLLQRLYNGKSLGICSSLTWRKSS